MKPTVTKTKTEPAMLLAYALRAPWPGAVLLHHCDGLNRPYQDYSSLLGRLLIAQAPGFDREARHPSGERLSSDMDEATGCILGYVDCCEIVDNREGDSQLDWARAGGAFIRFREPRIFASPVAAPVRSPGPLMVRSDLPELAAAIDGALTVELWRAKQWRANHEAMMSRACREPMVQVSASGWLRGKPASNRSKS